MGKVVNYRNEPPNRMYCQLKLDSTERVLISIGESGIRISKLGFSGRIRTGTIWRCDRDEIRDAFALFADPERPMTSTLDAIRDKLMGFRSIADIKAFLNRKPVELVCNNDN